MHVLYLSYMVCMSYARRTEYNALHEHQHRTESPRTTVTIKRTDKLEIATSNQIKTKVLTVLFYQPSLDPSISYKIIQQSLTSWRTRVLLPSVYAQAGLPTSSSSETKELQQLHEISEQSIKVSLACKQKDAGILPVKEVL